MIIFTQFILHDKLYGTQGENWLIAYTIEEVMMIVALYILYSELLQFSNGSWSDYFGDPYNIVDLAPPFMLLYLRFLESINHLDFYKESDREYYAIITSLSTLAVWFKLLNVFKIFQSTGFLIRAILDVLKSMGAFFIILLLFLLAFGNSHLVIMVANPAESATYQGANMIQALYLSYLVAAGEFMLDDGFGESAV